MPGPLAAFAGLTALLAIVATPSFAQEAMAVSQCQAVAGAVPNVTLASAGPAGLIHPAQAERKKVRISYVGHSTYLIETPGGVSIATDYSGYHGPDFPPTVVTMNKAHSGHNTPSPDPAIEHVLAGWNPAGGAADHDLVVGDVYIRNVTTDIRAGYEAMEADGNSIFIFEVAGLCIGHLGHLHHRLTDEHYAEIGRLDVLMVPVDGGLTLGFEDMREIVSRLRASVILPMHRRGPPISAFLGLFEEDVAREILPGRDITVSLRDLPDMPTIYVPQGI